jgi:hypothetical protein
MEAIRGAPEGAPQHGSHPRGTGGGASSRLWRDSLCRTLIIHSTLSLLRKGQKNVYNQSELTENNVNLTPPILSRNPAL